LAENGRRRLFFALWPDEAVREGLRVAQTAMPRRGGRPVHVEDIHVTLVFLGDVELDRLPCVLGAGAGVRGEGFELVIDRQGYWARPRVAWCAPTEVPQALVALVRSLERGLAGCGFEPERRPYSPHITLYRKSGGIPDAPLARPVRWSCRELVLVESNPAREGPRYVVLARWPLADSCIAPPPVQ
jgi:2'-5' RNA ligase